jgi:two-component system, cell cycle response regulator DivK
MLLEMVTTVDAVILIIEDEPLNVILTRTMLGIAGVRAENIHTCTTGRQALHMLDGLDRVDLILLDIQLPEESGYMILPKMRELPRLENIPIVAMTAFVTSADVQKIEQAGFDGFIGKPLNFDRFPDQIRRILRGDRIWDTH